MKKIAIAVTVFAVLAFAINPLKAEGTGTIRISPALPVMTYSSGGFDIWVQGAGDPTYDPHILLVMTHESWEGLTGMVVVTWTGGAASFAQGNFTLATSGYVPSSGTTEGARYTVAALQSHLGTDGPVYWVMAAFLEGPLTSSPQNFTVTLPSTAPRMLVYALGKTTGSTCTSLLELPTNLTATCDAPFNAKVPPSIPGFVVPEPSTVLLALASFSALGLYAFKRRNL